MNSLRKQRTLRTTASLTGFGYWSGVDVAVELRPAPRNTGLVFVRSDLATPVRIPALVAYRIDLPRRTSLAVGSVRVEMTEHILAALAAMQIDNCEIWVDQPELPAFDGSSGPVVDAILRSGVELQDADRPLLRIAEPIRLSGADTWIEARPATSPGLAVEYSLDYGAGPIGRQRLALHVDSATFVRELATARTFVLEEEAAWLRGQGLGTRVTYQDLLVFGPDGPLQNTLRFEDECVRHKTLDLIGDLALAGCDLQGQVVAYRSGHRLNAELVAALLEQAAQGQLARVSA